MLGRRSLPWMSEGRACRASTTPSFSPRLSRGVHTTHVLHTQRRPSKQRRPQPPQHPSQSRRTTGAREDVDESDGAAEVSASQKQDESEATGEGKHRSTSEAVPFTTPLTTHVSELSNTRHANRQTAASPSHGSSSLPLPPPRKSVEEQEKELLRYFGRARHLQDTVPLEKATAALQAASHTQACRVPFATLFPSPALASSPLAPRQPQDFLQGEGNAARGSDRAPAPPSALWCRAPFAAPHLFSNYDQRLRQCADWSVFRSLTSRFSTTIDGNKLFGATEVAFPDVAQRIAATWADLCAAFEEVVSCSASRASSLSASSSALAVVPRDVSVCFVVCFAQTQQTYAVGSATQDIVRQVEARCRASRATASEVFAVVPILVGLRSDAIADDDASMDGDVQKQTSPAGDDPHPLTFPVGGLYTFSAVVQCLSRMPPHLHTVSVDESSARDAPAARPRKALYKLHPSVQVLSDSWLHARSVAELHSQKNIKCAVERDGVREAPNGAAEGVDDAPYLWSEGDSTKGLRSPFSDAARHASFVPATSQQGMVQVFPGVVSDRLSVKERSAFATYLWFMMRRAAVQRAS